MKQVMRVLSAEESASGGAQRVLQLANDADPLALELDLENTDCIELAFPKFSDGRAFSQAYLLRRRRGFAGDIRATGDVLIDQLVQMQRMGFSSAVLRVDQDASDVPRQFERYAEYYQGDAMQAAPLFRRGGNAPAASTASAGTA